MALSFDVLVLPAFDDLEGIPGELTPWYNAYDFDETVQVDGVPTPVAYAEQGVGVVPTGVGKSAAATTVTALLASEAVDLTGTTFLTVGIAGGPPNLPIGSVVIGNSIIDWDDKCRFDTHDDVTLTTNPYTEGQGVYTLDSSLVDRALSLAETADLATDSDVPDPKQWGEQGADEPVVVSGANLCGDELWHGRDLAAKAEWLVDNHDVGPYRVTEMEDAGTAAALSRFDALDRYLTIRAISNFDRPQSDTAGEESLFGDAFDAGYGLAVENAVTVAKHIVDDQLTQ
ncbi:phosphorylase [Halovenus rubra]|uniref:Phosphorylase n=2 Tax=Halovenus rubra TaxID=869890 RepID=A0ABD5X3P1_9EURY|nr:phosphorylase [Halovenus rubra]